MTDITEAYDGGVGAVATRRRRIAGTALVAAGVAMVIGAIPLATTDLAGALDLSVYGARELAGVLAGLGIPAVLVGIFVVLPAGRVTRAAAAIGASLAVFGVALFAAAYPYNWVSNAPLTAVGTGLLYTTGTLVTFWCLFAGVATFKTRNDPGGAARVELTDQGTIRVVGSDDDAGLGGIGLFGSDPDGGVETQTNQDSESDASSAPTREPSGADRGNSNASDPVEGQTAVPTGDGGSAVAEAGASGDSTGAGAAADDADAVRRAARERGRPDRYCGNCAHFEYVRADGDIAPYCGLHDDLLQDMDACEQWSGNASNPGA